MPRPPSPPSDKSAAALIDQRVRDLGDWRGKRLQSLRELIHAVVPEVTEEWKWRGVPVWSHAGGICTGESYKEVVKLTFHNGAALSDPARLFNSSLEGNVRRAIDFREGDAVNAAAFKKLVAAAVAFNLAKKTKNKKAGQAAAVKPRAKGVTKPAAAKAKPSVAKTSTKKTGNKKPATGARGAKKTGSKKKA